MPDTEGARGVSDGERSTQADRSATSNTRREYLRGVVTLGGASGLPGFSVDAFLVVGSGSNGGRGQLAGPLQMANLSDAGSIDIPPFIGPDTLAPVVDGHLEDGRTSVALDVHLGTVGAIVSAASPKLGTPLQITESGEYRASVTQTVEGVSTFTRRGDGVIGVLNYVSPRLLVEDTSRGGVHVNGWPDLLEPPRPHARIFGLQPNDLLTMFGLNLLNRVPYLWKLPGVVKFLLVGLAVDVLGDVFEPLASGEDDQLTEEIHAEFPIETTFTADAARDYRLWQCFDVVTWALGKPGIDTDWGDVLGIIQGTRSIWDAEWDWDGDVSNRLEVTCSVDGAPTVERVGVAPRPPPVGTQLTVSKEGAPRGRGAYFVTAVDAIEQAVDSEAVIVENAAIDWVGPETGVDNLNLQGEISDFILKGQATVSIDGSQREPGSIGRTSPAGAGELSNTLRVEATGPGLGLCGVTVSGAIERGADSEAVIRGRSALDWVGPESGVDELRYSGVITKLLLKGDAEVYENGERLYPPVSRSVSIGGDSEVSTLTVTKGRTDDGLGAYAVTVTGELEATETSEAVVDGQTAVDWVGPRGGTDELRFTGDVEQFLLKGPATVYVDDVETDPSTLGTTASSDGTSRADLPNTLRVTKDGVGDGMGVYAVGVSGTIAPGEGSEAVFGDSFALDFVGPRTGTDRIRYSGELIALVVKGQAAVYRNGERVDPESVGG